MPDDPDVPPGFDRNPTAWPARLRIAALAAIGLAIASALTLYQVGALSSVWDPVFGAASSRTVLDLTSPLPDAAAGVLAYGAELVVTFIGGPDRWRTMPWTCLAFGALIVTGGIVSVALILVQWLVADAWCLLCLTSAAISFALLALRRAEA